MSQQEWENLASLLSLAVAAGAALVLWLGWIPNRWIESVESAFTKVARSRAICFVLIPLLSLALNGIITWHNGVPHPIIHDEFSYLLAADTFARGRLTNPTLPFFEHFETPHELMRPTFMSKYPPGQGIALAVGQITSGQPIVGVWLSTALATLAIYWMLLAFVPPSWALWGGIVAALHPLLVDWSRVYWGGSVAVLGGAMMLGAWGRLLIRPSICSSIVLGIGLIILANTRPYEGLIVSLPLLLVLVFTARRRRTKIVLPIAIVLAIGGLWMGYYNHRVTGHALRLPIVEYARQYDVYPKFWFLPTRPVPVYHNESTRWVHTIFEKGFYDDLRTWSGFAEISWLRIVDLVETNGRLAVLYIPLAVAIFDWRRRRVRWMLIALGICVLGLLAENFVQSHYEAPVTPLFLTLFVIGWQRLRASSPLAARAIAVGFLVGAGMADAQSIHRNRLYVEQQRFVDSAPVLQSGRHLIFVRYSPLHAFNDEYVFNRADLDTSPLIWARSFGPESDLPVAQRFGGRQVWLLNVAGKMDLQPYLMSIPEKKDGT
jgi:hypothetical protein